MRRPFATFLIPAFNAAQTIGETIESIKENDEFGANIVVVDDGSTDGTIGVASRHLRAKDRAIRIGENAGLSTALNIGIAVCDGLYLARIDADDLLIKGRVTDQIQHIERNKDVCFCGGQIEMFGEKSEKVRYPVGLDICNAALPITCCFAHPCTTINKERAGVSLYYDPRLNTSEDYDLWVRLQSEGRFGDNLSSYGIKYRTSSTSYTATRSVDYFRNDLAIRINALGNLVKDCPYATRAMICILGSDSNAIDPLADMIGPTLNALRSAKPRVGMDRPLVILREHIEKSLASFAMHVPPVSMEEYTRKSLRIAGQVMRYKRP